MDRGVVGRLIEGIQEWTLMKIDEERGSKGVSSEAVAMKAKL
jgi:hypothetical protein